MLYNKKIVKNEHLKALPFFINDKPPIDPYIYLDRKSIHLDVNDPVRCPLDNTWDAWVARLLSVLLTLNGFWDDVPALGRPPPATCQTAPLRSGIRAKII